MMKKLMLGNEAVARGAYEAGVSVVSSYPGTPSTEITEIQLNMTIYTLNGRRMKRLRQKLQSVRQSPAQEVCLV